LLPAAHIFHAFAQPLSLQKLIFPGASFFLMQNLCHGGADTFFSFIFLPGEKIQKNRILPRAAAARYVKIFRECSTQEGLSFMDPSIFNDVFGPIMIGPSSSHTAGPVRIGLMARDILGEAPESARIIFDPKGSFAGTYQGQGSDVGFISGLLGWQPDDERIPRSFEAAGEVGFSFAFCLDPIPESEHPNAVKLQLTSAHHRVTVVGESLCGGMVRILRINGEPVNLEGDREVEISFPSETGSQRRTLKPVLPVPTTAQCQAPLFTSIKEMVAIAEQEGISAGEMGIRYEMRRSGWSREQVLEFMARVWRVQKASMDRGVREELELGSWLRKPFARTFFQQYQNQETLLGGPFILAGIRALAGLEVDDAHGLVVPGPSAGGAGLAPGVALTVAELLHKGEDAVINGLFAAGAVGAVAYAKTQPTGEVCGCSGESGVGAAMAAAAAVDVAGGTARQAADAASIALQNLLGIPCDPVAGCIQVPCYTRCINAAVTALMSAQLVLSGMDALIPYDEVLETMDRIAAGLPADLKCTGKGGLAATPTAIKLSSR
jgi:L-serine dehydratase